MMQRLSGSMVAVRLCFNAASPAGVRGSLKPERSFPMFPTGVVPRMPFQYPLRSGCPSAVRGVGRFDFISGAVSSCATSAGVKIATKRHTEQIAFMVDLPPIAPRYKCLTFQLSQFPRIQFYKGGCQEKYIPWATKAAQNS